MPREHDFSDPHANVAELAVAAILQQLRDFKLDDPAVRAKMRERYGEKVPLDEPVISPVAMFESALLRELMRR